jgi:hypothetical protein
MKSRVEERLGRFDLAFVCFSAFGKPGRREAFGAATPAGLVALLVGVGALAGRLTRSEAFFDARLGACSRTIESGANAKTAATPRTNVSAARKTRLRQRGRLGTGSSRSTFGASSSARASAATPDGASRSFSRRGTTSSRFGRALGARTRSLCNDTAPLDNDSVSLGAGS